MATDTTTATDIPVRREPRLTWLRQVLLDPLGAFGLFLVLVIISTSAPTGLPRTTTRR